MYYRNTYSYQLQHVNSLVLWVATADPQVAPLRQLEFPCQATFLVLQHPIVVGHPFSWQSISTSLKQLLWYLHCAWRFSCKCDVSIDTKFGTKMEDTCILTIKCFPSVQSGWVLPSLKSPFSFMCCTKNVRWAAASTRAWLQELYLTVDQKSSSEMGKNKYNRCFNSHAFG